MHILRASQTATEICKKVRQNVHELGMDMKQIVALTTNNGKNMIKATSLLNVNEDENNAREHTLSQYQQFWKFNREKVPACLKSLLTSSGYDTLFSLCKLDIDKIREIEQYVCKNRKLLNNLNCCFAKEYREQTEFEFLSGHKAFQSKSP